MYTSIGAIIVFLSFITVTLLIKMYIDKRQKKKDWSVWANVITAIATVLVGIVTIFVMKSGDDIQKKLMTMEEAKNQPIFVLNEISEMSPGSDKYDYEDFHLYNYGAIVKSIEKVKSYVFVKLSYYKSDELIKLYAPIQDYFYRYYKTGSLQGEIALSYGSFKIHNVLNYVNHIHYDQPSDQSIILVNTELVKIYVVEYVDIYGLTKTICFERNKETAKDYVDSILECSQQQFGDIKFNLDNLSIDTIIATAEGLKRIN